MAQARSDMRSRKATVMGVGLATALLASSLGLAFYLLGPTGGNSANACEAATAPEALEPLATGEVAAFLVHDAAMRPPEIAFTDAEGQPRTLDDWRGRAILLNVWATWCAPCRHEMPMLDELQEEFGGADFEVVAVSIDQGETDKPLAFLDEVAADDLAFYHDPTTDVFAGLRAAGRGIGLPVTLLIDAGGCEVGYLAGPADWASEDAKALVRAVIAPS